MNRLEIVRQVYKIRNRTNKNYNGGYYLCIVRHTEYDVENKVYRCTGYTLQALSRERLARQDVDTNIVCEIFSQANYWGMNEHKHHFSKSGLPYETLDNNEVADLVEEVFKTI